ncbi:MAG: hypothetical protein KF902_03205 [Phycisphaeraceae bacterium]|nr:hypothetical protein [Phycisphaeraceae bacterium]MCW5769121.1 hypothetical protein [Phycisphaeraceae bacterium]
MTSVYILIAILSVAGGVMYAKISVKRGRFRPTSGELKYAGIALVAMLLIVALASQ